MVKEELSTSCARARVGLEETSMGQLMLATRNIEWMILWFESYHFVIISFPQWAIIPRREPRIL